MEYSEETFLKAFFGFLNKREIPYYVLRNYDGLPETVKGSDLDLWLAPFYKNLFMKALFKALSETGGVVLGEVKIVGYLKYSVLGKNNICPKHWWGLSLDLFFGVYYGGVVPLFNPIGPEKNQDFGKETICKLPEPVACSLGALKELLHNGKLPQKYLEPVKGLSPEEWDQVRKWLSPLGNHGFSIFKSAVCEVQNRGKAKAIARRLRRHLLRKAFRQTPFNYLKNRFLVHWSKVSRIFNPPGVVIAVLGADGSGKSTLIKAMEGTLRAATHGAFRTMHLRPGLLPPLASLKGQKKKQIGPVTEPHGSRPSRMIFSFLRLFYLIGDYVFGYWIKVRPFIAKSPAVVVFDRYFYDLEMDPGRFRIRLPGWVLHLGTWIPPRPDLILCLDGDPQKISARKKELPLVEVQRQISFLRKFAAREPRAVLISTDCSVEQSRDQALEALLSFCKSRCHFSGIP